eukprot:5821333-Prymnesium_polylepis.1
MRRVSAKTCGMQMRSAVGGDGVYSNVVELSDRTDVLGVTGWRWWLMAAASPARTVKAGRARGLSVLE